MNRRKLEAYANGLAKKINFLENQGQYEKDKLGRLYSEYYGDRLTDVFQTSTKARLENATHTINKLENRIDELERALKISGIIEELDESDIVKITTSDGFFASNKQFIVNKVI